jgi:hypothetical protein
VNTSGHRKTLDRTAKALAQLLGVEQSSLRFPARQPDAIVAGDGLLFVVREVRSNSIGQIAIAAEAAQKRADEVGRGAIPLVVSPFMSEAGRERCEAAAVAWLDFSGNARILIPGTRIVSLGMPNLFKRRGRPSSAFAPQSARLTRWLLTHSDRAWSQRNLAQATHMDEGFVSRIIGKLAEDRLIVRTDDGLVRARDPNLLLDAWREKYRFDKHQIIRGHVAARSGDALLNELGKVLSKSDVKYAATGLGAAWLLTGFAGFRLVSLYLKEQPSSDLIERLSFREETRGANLWLIVPNDEGVFQGSAAIRGIECVHPVQAFLDLGAHPERAKEAATELRKRLLIWN